jgi:hypothetical protein
VEITLKMVQCKLEQAQTLLSDSEAKNGAQYRFDRKLTRDDQPTTRQFDSQVPACGQAPDGSEKRHVAAWLHLQLLLAASRVESAQSLCTRQTGRGVAHSNYGQWPDRSCLERLGTLELLCGSSALGCTETTEAPYEADRATYQEATIVEPTTSLSTFASSSARFYAQSPVNDIVGE